MAKSHGLWWAVASFFPAVSWPPDPFLSFSLSWSGYLYEFPWATVINHYQLDGLKQPKFILSVLETRILNSVSLGRNQCWQGRAALPRRL